MNGEDEDEDDTRRTRMRMIRMTRMRMMLTCRLVLSSERKETGPLFFR